MRYTLKPETKLQRHVAKFLRETGKGYDDGIKGAASDLFQGGCASGFVGHLIYTRDCVAFYLRHAREIDGMVADFVRDTGCDCRQLTGWDERDPMARDDNNRNVLAWFAFEETARDLCNGAGIDC